MVKQNEQHATQAPDRQPLASSQAARLASLTGLKATELKGLSTAEVNDKFRWKIDPELFLFRRICGKIVKTDPATGVSLPVPFATVNIFLEESSTVYFTSSTAVVRPFSTTCSHGQPSVHSATRL